MEADIPGPASPPDPPQDRPGSNRAGCPSASCSSSRRARILLGYRSAISRPPSTTVPPAPRFPSIAACFWHRQNSPHNPRPPQPRHPGAAALERLSCSRRRNRPRHQMVTAAPAPKKQSQPAPATPNPSNLDQPASPKPRPTARPLPPGSDRLRTLSCPHRKNSIVRCAAGRRPHLHRDLPGSTASSTGSAQRPSRNGIFEIMHYSGGNVVITVMREKTHHEQTFIREQDKKLGSTWDWLHLKRDEMRQASASSSANHRSIHSATPPNHWPPAPPDPWNAMTLTHGGGAKSNPALPRFAPSRTPLPRKRGRQGEGEAAQAPPYQEQPLNSRPTSFRSSNPRQVHNPADLPSLLHGSSIKHTAEA